MYLFIYVIVRRFEILLAKVFQFYIIPNNQLNNSTAIPIWDGRWFISSSVEKTR